MQKKKAKEINGKLPDMATVKNDLSQSSWNFSINI